MIATDFFVRLRETQERCDQAQNDNTYSGHWQLRCAETFAKSH